MAITKITLNLLDENLILEIELEKSIQLKTIIDQLKEGGHLISSKTYYVKSISGDIQSEDVLSERSHPKKLFITTDESWNQVFTSTIDDNEVIKVTNEIVLHEDTYWFVPLLSNISNSKEGIRFHLFNITGIRMVNGDSLEANVVIQYSELDETKFRNQIFDEFVAKISQIISDTIRIELSEIGITSKNFYDDVEKIRAKILEYVNAHTKMGWNVRIENLSIMNFSHRKQGDQMNSSEV